MATELAVTGVGMSTSLGNAVHGSAAARAGITRPSEVDFVACTADEIMPVQATGHCAPLPRAFQGFARLALLTADALADLLRNAGPLPEGPTHAILNLPDPYTRPCLADYMEEVGAELTLAAAHQCFAQMLNRVLPVGLEHVEIAYHSDGRAGVLAGVEFAARILQAGRSQRCIVGGVDSLIESDSLEWLFGTGQLKAPGDGVGLAPGEGAAVVLLEGVEAARARQSPVLARVVAVEVGDEEYELGGTDVVPTGRGLVGTIEAACAGGIEPGTVVSDQNGTIPRAMEWGYAVPMSIGRGLTVAEAPLMLPALSFGDLGAGYGAVATVLACRTFARSGWNQGPALVVGSSDDGMRAAMVLDRHEGVTQP